jgi:ferredoxin, 2Fe-2S
MPRIIYIEHNDEAWRAATREPDAGERGMIESARAVGAGSRLACQIKVSDALDGLIVHLPVSQH